VKIILTQDVSNLGQAGDVQEVADGYARNYLIPNGMAEKATPGVVKDFKRRQAAAARRAKRLTERAEALAQRLSDVTLTFEAKAGETGRLYGSVTTTDIAEALEREVGEEFDRRKQVLCDPIRQVGEHVVPVQLAADVTAQVKVVVTQEGGELPEAAEEEASDDEAQVEEP